MSRAYGTTNHVIGNTENVSLQARKTTAHGVNPFKRPILGDVGNRLDRLTASTQPNNIKKVQPAKGATVAKDDSKYTKLLKPTRKLLKQIDSTSSLFSSQTVTVPATNQTEKGDSYSAGVQEIEDVDKNDLGNPSLVASYAADIYRYLLELEQQFPVRSDFLSNQDISPRMRATLVDWLIDVQEQYKLLQETLFLTISLIDRYLQDVQTDRKHLQLVGVAALFIAGKYEEIYFLDVSELAFVTDNAYTKADVLSMEKKILKQLNFDLGKPISLHFLRRFSKVASVLPIHHNFSKYFLEWSLMDYDLCHIRPSRLAAAALFIAQCICGKTDEPSAKIWNRTLEHFSGVACAEVLTIAQKMAGVILKARTSKFQAIERKYSSAKLMKVCQRPELATDILKKLAVGAYS